ncbi:MAG: hypothetical protein HYY45_12145, partial [Deltaproteobacteria bacterium]|nr:hypothetical protein [Deltaproteobacteria bacterium]
KEFTVPILNDTIPESHETVNLSLSNPINPGGSASLATPNTAVLTILNDDVTFRFTSASYSVSESAGTASISVERIGETTNNVAVDFYTSDGTAIGDFQPDYVPTSGTLTFSPGEFTKSFTISIVNDSLVEGNETVNLSLSNAISVSAMRLIPMAPRRLTAQTPHY